MANAPIFHLYGWQRYSWAQGRGQIGRLSAPAASGISATRATITVGLTPATQAAQHRVIYGTRQGCYDKASPVVSNAEGSTITVPVKELVAGTTYYMRDLAWTSPPNAATSQFGNPYAEWISAEASFATP